MTTVPLGVDDIDSPNIMEHLAVQFFNGAGHFTISTGANHPRTSVLVTSNKHFAECAR